MKKLFLLILVSSFTLTACGGIKATVPDNPYAKESQAIVEKWIAAYQNRDGAALLSLYSDDIVYSFCGNTNCDRSGLDELKGVVPDSLKDPEVKTAFQSYFLTKYGERAVVQGRYTDPYWPVENAQTVVILEIKNGKITSETWYWDGS